MAIQLDNKYRLELEAILKEHVPQVPCYVFGSRAMGTAQKHSDIDIVLKGKEAIPLSQIASLKFALSDSDLPYLVDVVDWYRISTEFQRKIQSHWVELAW